MNKFWNWLKNFLFNITLKDIIYICAICALFWIFSIFVGKYQDATDRYNNNIRALNDSIHYYYTKTNELVATKLAFEGELKDLKLLNKTLYDEIKKIKPKGDVTNATYVTGYIENEVHDTTYVVKHDTIKNGFYKEFNFNNDFRKLEGNVRYLQDTVGVSITKDLIYFDYTIAMDDKNNIYVKSTNPYVKYNEISGFQVPKQKNKRWFTGPSINAGYDPIQNKPTFSIGWSLGYGLFKW